MIRIGKLFLLSVFVLLVFALAGCGNSGGGSDSNSNPPQMGYLDILNNSGSTITGVDIRPSGSNNWAGWNINGQPYSIPNAYHALDSTVPVGSYDFKYSYTNNSYQTVEKVVPNAFNVSTSEMAVTNINPNGNVSFTYESNPSGSSSSSGSGSSSSACSDCSNNTSYQNWLQQCSNTNAQAACYCAAAVLERCCGDTTDAQTNYDFASQLGTKCW
ncbi:MAG: hypothetical protein M0Z61_10835 [Nitrospiraceae bacterium]|nr:hypothetical protein [Nitrospiraceae bacterium]